MTEPLRYHYATIQVSREWVRQEMPASAQVGVWLDMAMGKSRGEAIAHQARRTGYVVADRPEWPTIRIWGKRR